MQYLIGMDGGGTKTACVVTDLEGNKLYECTGGPSTFLMLGADKVAEMLFNLISECCTHLNAGFEDFRSIVLGTTGAGRRSDAERMENAFLNYAAERNAVINKFQVESDGRIALEGAFSGKPGSILIAGTGSFMLGKDFQGNIHRVGGFGRFIGDQGSGYMLGRRGLCMIAKDYDGRGEKTALTKLLAERMNIDSPENLIIAVYKNNFDIASVAPLVMEAAASGDEVCHSILEEESHELVLHIFAMMKKLKEPAMNLSLIGGIISTENPFSAIFIERVHKLIPNVHIQEPEFPPAMGAVFMAQKLMV